MTVDELIRVATNLGFAEAAVEQAERGYDPDDSATDARRRGAHEDVAYWERQIAEARALLDAQARHLERLRASCAECYVVHPNGNRYEIGAMLLSLADLSETQEGV